MVHQNQSLLSKGSTSSILGANPNWPEVLGSLNSSEINSAYDSLSIPTEGDLSRSLIHMFILARNRNRSMFCLREGNENSLQISPWKKSPEEKLQGSGVVSLARGNLIEKAAVNFSYVWGKSYPSIEKDYAGKPFVAAGVSLICHPLNPHAPIAHMNIRILQVGQGQDKITWMGGGADLTPMIEYPEDTEHFHNTLQRVCDRHPSKADYPKFKSWCDEYFYIPHRGNTRGVGGIFFDYVPLHADHEAELLLDVATSFCDAYGDILGARMGMPFDPEQKERQLYWRGRYAEFNLVYDRGTRFGLMSGGNADAILASLPPVVKW